MCISACSNILHTQAKATMLSQWKSTLMFEKGDKSEYFQKMPPVEVHVRVCGLGNQLVVGLEGRCISCHHHGHRQLTFNLPIANDVRCIILQ